MEVTYKRQQNKITSIERETANRILKNSSEDIGESLLNFREQLDTATITLTW